jgi:hypothetical protein
VALARSVSRLALTVICFVALSYPMVAQSGPAASAEEKHAYTKYEQLVYDNVTQFHKKLRQPRMEQKRGARGG